MELLAAWIVFPLAFVISGIGVGLLVERVAGFTLPSAALIPLGTCASMCGLLAVYAVHANGIVAGVVLVGGTVAGYAGARHELRQRLRPAFGAAAALFVALLYLAPTLLTGHWSWNGYNFLNDTAVQFLLADQLQHHGVQLVHHALSTRSETIRTYIESGYPLATHAHLATLATLDGIRVDVAYQSYLAMLAATSSLSLFVIGVRSGLTPRSAALAATAALTANLMYQYALQGSIKEVAAFTCLAAAAMLGQEAVAHGRAPRAVLPAAIAAAAMIGSFSAAAVPYLGVLALLLAASVFWTPASPLRSRPLTTAGLAIVVALVAALPTLLSAFTFLRASDSALTSGAVATSTLGQLQRPLEAIQLAGVWLSENYALPILDAQFNSLTSVMNWVVILLAVAGVVLFVRRRTFGPLLLLVTVLVTTAVLAPRTSPYADAKMLAVASPAVVFAAVAGALSWRGRLRIPGLVAACAAGLALLGSAAFAYHGVRTAPVGRLHALEDAVAHVPQNGWILLDEVEEFGKYYARDAPHFNVAFESITPRQAQPFGGGYHLDLDSLVPAYVQSFDTVVTRRGPATSRPPANYRRIYANAWYEAWEKDRNVAVRAHLPVQQTLDAGGVAPCRAVRALARRTRPGDRLVAASSPETVELPVSNAPDRPAGWPPLAVPPGVVEPRSPGVVERPLRFHGGTYDAWVRASTGRRLTVSVDGRRVGSVDQLNTQGQWLSAGSVALGAGRHRVRLERPGGGLAPGDGVVSVLGPVALVRRQMASLRTLAPARARNLCGQRLDWVEVVGR